MSESNRNSKGGSPPGSAKDSPPGSKKDSPQGSEGSSGPSNRVPVIRWAYSAHRSVGEDTRINYSVYDQQNNIAVHQSFGHTQPILRKALTDPPGRTSEFQRRDIIYKMPILHRALTGPPAGNSEYQRRSHARTSILRQLLTDQSRNPGQSGHGQSRAAALQHYRTSSIQNANRDRWLSKSSILRRALTNQPRGNLESPRQISGTNANEMVRTSRPEPRANIPRERLPHPPPETNYADPPGPVETNVFHRLRMWFYGGSVSRKRGATPDTGNSACSPAKKPKRDSTPETGNSSKMPDPPVNPAKKPKQD